LRKPPLIGHNRPIPIDNFGIEATVIPISKDKDLLQTLWENLIKFDERQLYDLLRIASHPISSRESKEVNKLRKSVGKICSILKKCGKGKKRLFNLSETSSLFSLLIAHSIPAALIIEPQIDIGQQFYFDYAVYERVSGGRIRIPYIAEVKRLNSTGNLKEYTEEFLKRVKLLKRRGVRNVTFIYHIHLTSNFIGKDEVLNSINALKPIELLLDDPKLKVIITLEETYSKFKERLERELGKTLRLF